MSSLADGQPALVVARSEHLAGIMATLGQALDVRQLQASGLLVMREARDMLSTLMDGEMPGEARVAHTVTPLLEALSTTTGRPVRIYGEMVDLLWHRGNKRAALRLEELWTATGDVTKFSLLCGYAMNSMFHVNDVDDICDLHTHVFVDAWDRPPA